MRSPIRWAGSKRALLPTLVRYWNENPTGKYIEPFCGSACLYFEIEPRKAILGDINRDLISAYKNLSKSPSKVIDCIRRYPITERTYYKLRQQAPESLPPVEQTARFLFLNRLCFNGIYRTNTNGQFNVPYGRPKSKVRFDFDTLLEAATVLKRASLDNRDFADVIGQAKRGDFVYLDPPYAVAKRRVFSQYHPDSFTERDLHRLRECLRWLDKKGARFVVSYADSREGRELLKDWEFHRVRARRNVAGFADKRRHVYELLAANYELTTQ